MRLGPGTGPTETAHACTDAMYGHHDAVHHVDLWAGETRYRTFLLRSTLQVDISFWPARDFLPRTPSLQAGVFGELGEPRDGAPPTPSDHPVGMAWLYALHVGSALERDRHWQAVHMLDGMRDRIVAIACTRAGLPGHQGRDVDRLPVVFIDALVPGRARDLQPEELRRAFRATTRVLLVEIHRDTPDLARRLRDPLEELAML